MAEIFTANATVVPPVTVLRIALIAFDWLNQRIDVRLRAWNGSAFVGEDVVSATYTGPDAVTLMTALNKTNLSTQSLHQRVIARLLADGKIPSGTASGNPD